MYRHIEILVGIIATCVPCLEALFEQMLQRFGYNVSSTREETFPSTKFTSPHMQTFGSQNSRIGTAIPLGSIDDNVWDGTRAVRLTISGGTAISPEIETKDIIVKDESVSWE